MQSLQQSILQTLFKIVTVTSPAYGNTLAFQKEQNLKDVENKLQPGDIIFSRTKSNTAEIARKYIGINYDHVAVIINEREVVHVSPPIISKLDMSYIMHPGRQPLIIRPKLEDMQKFLVITQNYLGQKYNLKALWQVTFRQLKAKLKQQQKNEFSLATLKHSRICSDSVLYALIRSSSKIEQSIQNQIKKTKYQHLGFFLPDQVAAILLVNGAQIILKSTFQHQYKFIKTLESGGEKVLNFLQKSIQYAKIGKNQLSDTVTKWKKQKTQAQLKKQTVNGFQIISLIMSLAHLMGVVTLAAKTRFILLVLHAMIMIGHFQSVKNIVLNRQSRL